MTCKTVSETERPTSASITESSTGEPKEKLSQLQCKTAAFRLSQTLEVKGMKSYGRFCLHSFLLTLKTPTTTLHVIAKVIGLSSTRVAHAHHFNLQRQHESDMTATTCKSETSCYNDQRSQICATHTLRTFVVKHGTKKKKNAHTFIHPEIQSIIPHQIFPTKRFLGRYM